MADLRSLVVKNGTTQGITTADTLIVGNKLDAASGQTLTVGGTNATGITIGSGLITTSFPGPVELVGDVTTVGGTTFTTDATFEGNVTFGNGPSDTVTFAATTTVVSDINFGGSAAYKITNLADPTSAQDAATQNYVDTEIGSATNVGNTFVAVGNGTGIVGSSALTWNGNTFAVTNGGAGYALSVSDADGAIFFVEPSLYSVSVVAPLAPTDAFTMIQPGQVTVYNNGSGGVSNGYMALLSALPATEASLRLQSPAGSGITASVIAQDETSAAAALKLVATEIDVDSKKIINVANGTNPNDAVNFSQLSAIVSGVSAVSATAPLLSSGGATPDISIDTAGASSGDVLTYNGSAWAAAAIPPTDAQGGANAVQYANSATPTAFDGDATLFSFAEGTSTLTVSNGAANSTAITPSTVIVAEGSDGVTITGSASAANVQVALGTDLATYGAFQLAFQTTTGTTLFNENGITSPAPFDLYAATKVTATIDGGATYLLTPDSIDALTYAASVALDLDPSLPALKSVTLTGDITFTTSNVGAARNISVRVIGDASSRNLVFPAGWTWLGGAAPTVLEANKVAILSLAAFGATDSTIVASWSYDGSDVVTDVTASSPLASSGGATPNISLTGVIGVANGGTGQSSLTSGALVVGNGGSAVNTLSPGSNGQVLTGVGGAWAAAALPASTDYSVVTLTTAQAANTAVTVAGAAAIATAASTSRVAGIVTATNTVKVLGICTCDVEGALSIAAGDAVYLSASEAGAVTNVAPSDSGEVVAELGIATAASSGGTVAVLWQPKSIVVL